MPKRYVIVLVIIAIVLFGGIAILISSIMNRGSGESAQEPVKTAQRAKELSKDTSNVSFTTYGRVVGEENRRAIRITVSSNERRVDVLQGYDEDVIKTQTTPNKQSAFDALLIALESAGFDTYDKNNKIDERSQCATGNRYAYQAAYQDGASLRSWSTNCSEKIGSFKGNRSLVQTLFQNQIPDYSKFVSGTRL